MVYTKSDHFHLSPAYFKGTHSPRTLRVAGRIKELDVTILVDSGSSHNIIQPRIAKFLGVPVVAISPFSVMVGSGNTIQCLGLVITYMFELAEQEFSISIFVLPIHADLVLGVQWLQTLGTFRLDFSISLIQFTYNKKPISLIGTTQATPM